MVGILRIIALTGSISTVTFAAQAQDASHLGKDLTALGAIRAGNADHTIPPYEGGIASPPVGYKRGDHHADPFAAEAPLAIITAANAAGYGDKLTPGDREMLKRYPDFSIALYPTHRTAAMPKRIEDETIANAGRAKLTPDGNGVIGARIGIPFPIPRNGLEAIYNHRMRYHGDSVEYLTHSASPTQSGDFTPVSVDTKVLQAYSAGLDTGNLQTYFLEEVTGPARLAGEVLLVHETLDQIAEPRAAWTYNPGQRRVRRAPNVAYDNPGTASDGLTTNDELDIFNGATDRYDWKLLGRLERIIPYNTYKLASDKLKLTDIIKANHIAPDLLRYELHRVWVVEATLKPGASHIYARRVFYLDEDSWGAQSADIYDQRGALWRVDENYGLQFWEVPVYGNVVHATYDLQSGRYLVTGLYNENPAPNFSIRLKPEDFTAETLRTAGIR